MVYDPLGASFPLLFLTCSSSCGSAGRLTITNHCICQSASPLLLNFHVDKISFLAESEAKIVLRPTAVTSDSSTYTFVFYLSLGYRRVLSDFGNF